MENWQESYKKHQALANEVAEKSIAQEVLQIGSHNWEQNGQFLTKGELTHIRLWLKNDELSNIEKQLISESQKAILNQASHSTQSGDNNLLIGLISTNILVLLCVAVISMYYFAFSKQVSQQPQSKLVDSQQVPQLKKQISNLKNQVISLRESVTTVNEQKNAYYAKWILQAVDNYIDQPQMATALLLRAFEHSSQQIFIEHLYDIVAQHGQQSLKVLDKHQIDIQYAIFSPDSQYVVTVSIEGFGYLWNIATGKVKLTFMLPDWSPLSYAKFSHNGEFLLIAGGNTALVWDMAQQKQIGLLKGHSAAILSASFSDDNQYVVTASQDKTARLWKTETSELLQTYIGHQDLVYTVEFSPNNQLIATGSKDGTAKLWQVKTGQLMHSFSHYQKAVKYLCFQEDSLVVASFDGQIQFWDIDTTKQLHSFNSENTALKSFSCQTDKIAASFANNTIHILKSINAKPLTQFTFRNPINHVDLNKKLLVTASKTKVSIQNWQTQKQLYSFSHPKRIRQIVISPNGNHLLVIVGELAYIYPLFHSQSGILRAAELIIGDKPLSILKQFEIE
ncbi:WD40 repeat domain-containing protein [Candidatus Albibeggiatoa sp. nov. BB20]|uniref:WD40 repeat domain-containing protein n=1 Tax=Candidatus Albibeggiatoa sp. nov. BB20 TaxID=3162723 RepID=UPI0033655F1E